MTERHTIEGTSQSTSLPIKPPLLTFYSGRSDSFTQFGSEWRRMSPEDLAHFHTGYDREAREPNIGIYIVRRPNGLLRIGFDLVRLDVRLQTTVTERLKRRWQEEAANFSKPLFRATIRRTHFSRSFAQFEIAPERVEEWKQELSRVLCNPESYESIEQRTNND